MQFYALQFFIIKNTGVFYPEHFFHIFLSHQQINFVYAYNTKLFLLLLEIYAYKNFSNTVVNLSIHSWKNEWTYRDYFPDGCSYRIYIGIFHSEYLFTYMKKKLCFKPIIPNYSCCYFNSIHVEISGITWSISIPLKKGNRM